MKKKMGFTLIELLAVIVILAIILAIAIPSITTILNNSTKKAFESDAKMVLNTIRLKLLENNTLDLTSISTSTISTLNLSNDNYDYLRIGTTGVDQYAVIKGKNKWAGLIACGYLKNMTIFESNNLSFCETAFNYTGNYQTFTVPTTGQYQIELWGAQGYGTIGGKGAYTKGNINLNKDTVLYVYTGQAGSNVTTYNLPTFNGGGGGSGTCYNYNGGTSSYNWQGGGATDIRLLSGVWNDTTGLISRIMVAAGGGGRGWTPANTVYGGAGGGIEGYDGQYLNNSSSNGLKATQVASGNLAGAFGIGGNSADDRNGCNCSEGSGGGGGYYGGGGSRAVGYYFGGAGGGGSSFISGHSGCNAINSSGVATGQANHYSGYIFTNTEMIDGEGYGWSSVKGGLKSMPSPTGGLEVGHTDNGYARITFLGQ